MRSEAYMLVMLYANMEGIQKVGDHRRDEWGALTKSTFQCQKVITWVWSGWSKNEV